MWTPICGAPLHRTADSSPHDVPCGSEPFVALQQLERVEDQDLPSDRLGDPSGGSVTSIGLDGLVTYRPNPEEVTSGPGTGVFSLLLLEIQSYLLKRYDWTLQTHPKHLLRGYLGSLGNIYEYVIMLDFFFSITSAEVGASILRLGRLSAFAGTVQAI